jgi:hypothetical protein
VVLLIESGKKTRGKSRNAKREKQIPSSETISDNECPAKIYVNLKMFSVAKDFLRSVVAENYELITKKPATPSQRDKDNTNHKEIFYRPCSVITPARFYHRIDL